MDDLTFHMLCAPSGSGKTTYVSLLVGTNPKVYILSPDNLRLELSGNMADQTHNALIFGTIIPERIAAAAGHSWSVIYDATSINRKARKPIIALARQHGYRIVAHVIKTPIEECKRRNAARDRVVPNEVIDSQFARWVEPALDEGIDEIVELESVNP